MHHLLRWAALALVAVALLAVAGVAWYYAGEILLAEQPAAPSFDTNVYEVRSDQIVLEATDEAERPGTWGLAFPGGYGQIGPPLDSDEPTSVTRPFTALDGTPRAGARADVDAYGYPDDPAAAGFAFEVTHVEVEGPLGRYPAWRADGGSGGLDGGSDRLWAIFVHGRAARRSECFRLLPTLVDLGISTLCASYRNDAGAPQDPDGLYRQGAEEWRDIAAALEYARAEGAEQIVLAGASMGGQISASLLRFERPDDVAAVVWDAPALDWGPAIRQAVVNRGVPTWLVPLGMAASELRAGIDYDALNHVSSADEFDVPILLFHGAADQTVPVEVSDRFAAARPDLVTYRRTAGADHVQSWNADPRAYADAVASFLTETLAGD